MGEFLILAVLLMYYKYNESKEEKARKRGYKGSCHPDTEQRRVINKRVFLARCIYGMYYRQRGHTEFRSWWEGYDLVPNEDVLGDDCKHYEKELEGEKRDNYFGVLQRRNKYPLYNHGAPEWIVAVRGTEIWHLHVDGIKDVSLLLQIPKKDDFKLLQAVVERLIRKHGRENVVLTGHSLGAWASMLVGRNLAQGGDLVEAHLFNPPFVTITELFHAVVHFSHLPLILPMASALKFFTMAEFITFALKAVVNPTLLDVQPENADAERARESFRTLGGWTPHLYVHKRDVICMQNLEHFEKFWPRFLKSVRVERINQTEDAVHILPHAVLHTSDELDSRLPRIFDVLRPISSHMLWNWASPKLECKTKRESLLKS